GRDPPTRRVVRLGGNRLGEVDPDRGSPPAPRTPSRRSIPTPRSASVGGGSGGESSPTPNLGTSRPRRVAGRVGGAGHRRLPPPPPPRRRLGPRRHAEPSR